jgi:hypothetical protein
MESEFSDIPVGAGVVVDSLLILTCAHVVNSAIGLAPSAENRPSADVKIWLRFHATMNSTNVPATIHPDESAWSRPPASRSKGADLCVLKLSSPYPDGVSSALICAFNQLSGRKFRSVGYPKRMPKGDIALGIVPGNESGGLYILRPDSTPRDFSIKGGLLGLGDNRPAGLIYQGFSGGPVEIDGRIAGLICEALQVEYGTAYMIPASTFPTIMQDFIETRMPHSDKYPHLEQWDEILDELSTNKKINRSVRFDIRLRLCDSFDEVLSSYRSHLIDEAGEEAGRKKMSYVDGIDLTPSELADRLIRGGNKNKPAVRNIILHAPGGAGKSSFLIELMRVAPYHDLIPFFIEFSSSANDQGNLNQGNLKRKEILEDWFNSYHGKGSIDTLLWCLEQKGRDGTKPLLIIDGFNQANRDLNKELIKINDLANQILSGAAIIVADRMIEREVKAPFKRAVIPPLVAYDAFSNRLSPEIANDEYWVPILSSPLFLEIFLETLPPSGSTAALSGITSPSRFNILNRYFKECHFSDAELQVLAETAFKAYQNFGGTEIKNNDFTSIISEYAGDFDTDEKQLLYKIDKYGLVNDAGNQAKEFRHQIIHDFLAALRVASAKKDEEETMLRAPAFDALTLNAASSDAIELALEALQEPDQLLFGARTPPLTALELLTAVYDWNFWITLQCVMSFDRRGTFASANSPIQQWLRHAVYALNLEKKFDPFLHTAIRAEQLSGQIAKSSNLLYTDCPTHNALITEISKILEPFVNTELPESEQGYLKSNEYGSSPSEKRETYGEPQKDREYARRWKYLYTRKDSFSRDDLCLLWSDPLISWTAANVLRRFDLTPDLSKDLLRLYDASKSTSDSSAQAAGFRWRIMHVLGRADAKSVSDSLINIMFDTSENVHVRYGAVRSVVEVTALSGDSEYHKSILGTLELRLPELFDNREYFPLHSTEVIGRKPGISMLQVRKELMRCCAINESDMPEQNGWRDVWLDTGLSGYKKVLENGAVLCRQKMKGKEEIALWDQWVDAINEVKQLYPQTWNSRRAVWSRKIGKVQ